MKKLILKGATSIFIGLASLTFSSLTVEAKGHDCIDDWGLRLNCDYDYVNEILSVVEPLTSLTNTFSDEVINAGQAAVDALQYCIDKPHDTEVSGTTDPQGRLLSDFADSAGRLTKNYEIYYCGVEPCEALRDFWNSIYSSDNAMLKADQKDFFVTGDNNIRYHCSRQRGSFGHVTKDSWKTSDF
jgi:hypothetical protein